MIDEASSISFQKALPSFLHRCLVTPQEHALHHARPPGLSRSNYANVFPLWDILFGTFQHPDDHGDVAFGIDEPLPGSFAAQLALPLAMWAQPSPPAMASPARQPSTRSPSKPSPAKPPRSSP